MIEVELQRALYSRLAGASLGVTGVYDIAPQDEDGGDDAAFPYVVMGKIILSQADTQTKNGYAAQIRLHTYSRTGSRLECLTIQSGIYAALHRVPLSITGFSNFSLLREDTDCTYLGDSKVHGVCEYRALIESA